MTTLRKPVVEVTDFHFTRNSLYCLPSEADAFQGTGGPYNQRFFVTCLKVIDMENMVVESHNTVYKLVAPSLAYTKAMATTNV